MSRVLGIRKLIMGQIGPISTCPIRLYSAQKVALLAIFFINELRFILHE